MTAVKNKCNSKECEALATKAGLCNKHYLRKWSKSLLPEKKRQYKANYEQKDKSQPQIRWTALNTICRQRKARINSRDMLRVSKTAFIKWAEDNRQCKYCNTSELGTGSGVDRIDSSKAYTIDNIVTCCKHCNAAKGTLTADEFKAHIKRIYEHFCKG
jgi:5-methylcytosine-specific restriction endonuclease McrA